MRGGLGSFSDPGPFCRRKSLLCLDVFSTRANLSAPFSPVVNGLRSAFLIPRRSARPSMAVPGTIRGLPPIAKKHLHRMSEAFMARRPPLSHRKWAVFPRLFFFSRYIVSSGVSLASPSQKLGQRPPVTLTRRSGRPYRD